MFHSIPICASMVFVRSATNVKSDKLSPLAMFFSKGNKSELILLKQYAVFVFSFKHETKRKVTV